MNTEIWLPIKEYEDLYMISDHGNVKSLISGIILRPSESRGSYKYVILYGAEKPKNKKIHRLVAEHFIGNIDSKPQVNHIDANRHNNHQTNLEWVTNFENVGHMKKLERMAVGSRLPQSKLTESDIKEIKKLRLESFTLKYIGDLYNVSQSSIERVVNNKSWRHVAA